MNKLDSSYILTWSKRIRAIDLLGGCCKKCGNDNIFHLEFHHVSDVNKDVDISRIINGRWSLILGELTKCVLLCKNCHGEFHLGDNKNSIKIKLLQIKGASGCSKCGYNKSNACLDFHHIKDKNFIISKGYKNRVMAHSIEDIILEMDKCNVLCRNCHGELRINKNKFNKFRDNIYSKINDYQELRSKIDRDKIEKLYNDGMGVTQISKFFNCSKGAISMALKKIRRGRT